MKDNKNMKNTKNKSVKNKVQKTRKQESDKTPTYLLILISLLVLVAFAVITISTNMKSNSDKSVIDDIKETIDYKSELVLPKKVIGEYQKLINIELIEVKRLNEEILNKKFI